MGSNDKNSMSLHTYYILTTSVRRMLESLRRWMSVAGLNDLNESAADDDDDDDGA